MYLHRWNLTLTNVFIFYHEETNILHVFQIIQENILEFPLLIISQVPRLFIVAVCYKYKPHSLSNIEHKRNVYMCPPYLLKLC